MQFSNKKLHFLEKETLLGSSMNHKLHFLNLFFALGFYALERLLFGFRKCVFGHFLVYILGNISIFNEMGIFFFLEITNNFYSS